MSAANVLAYLRLLGERRELLDDLKVRSKDEVLAAAAEAGLPFSAAEWDELVWDLESRLAQRRGEEFDMHFPLWRTLWGRHYLEVLVVDLVPALAVADVGGPGDA